MTPRPETDDELHVRSILLSAALRKKKKPCSAKDDLLKRWKSVPHRVSADDLAKALDHER